MTMPRPLSRSSAQATPIVTNRTGLEFDLALILRGLAASAFFNASIDIGPFTVGAGLDFEIGPLFEEKFELLNLDIVDLFNGTFQLEDTETTSFILGAPAPETDFGDAIVGTTGNDTLDGTPEADIIIGLAGDDVIYGDDGDDLIQPGEGANTVFGGDGYDTLSYQDIPGTIPVRPSDPRAGAFYSVTAVVGEPGPFVFTNALGATGSGVSGTDIERVVLSPFADNVDFFFRTSPGGGLPELIETLGGEDRIWINASNVTGSDLAQTILAGAGDDDLAIIGPHSNSTMDQLLLDGGDGIDNLDTHYAVDLTAGVTSNGVRLVNIENVEAASDIEFLIGDGQANVFTTITSTDITLDGRGGNDVLEGGNGNDTLIGGAGADGLFGGGGIDTADYSGAATSVFVDLDFGGVGRGFRGEAQGDELQGVENVIGSDFEDILFGDNAANTLTGGEGDDRLQTQGANDLLQGGADNDLLNRGTVVINLRAPPRSTMSTMAATASTLWQPMCSARSPRPGSHSGTATVLATRLPIPVDLWARPITPRPPPRTPVSRLSHRYVRSGHIELDTGRDRLRNAWNTCRRRRDATRSSQPGSAGTADLFVARHRVSAGRLRLGCGAPPAYNNNIADQTLEQSAKRWHQLLSQLE